MPIRLSAIDSIGPAFATAKSQLFAPFRWRHWARLAVVSLLTGEFAESGGWSGGNYTYNRSGTKSLWLAAPSEEWREFLHYLPWIIAGALLLFAFILLWMYVSSVYRFVLFDSVLYNRCQLREGWHRWRSQGTQYFLWSLGLLLGTLAAALVVAALPLLLAWQAGFFHHPRQHLPALILGGIGLAFLLIAVFLVAALAGFFAKDFCVPLMALDNLGILDAWRRLFPLLSAEKMAYAGFLLMKIVLAVGSTIIFGIITLLALLAFFLPVGAAGALLYFLAKGAGLTWNVVTLSGVVVLGGVLVGIIFFIVAVISTPVMVFFQAYVLHFFGSRYPALNALLHPSPPAPEPPPPLAPAPAT
jgi:hypothetical protein